MRHHLSVVVAVHQAEGKEVVLHLLAGDGVGCLAHLAVHRQYGGQVALCAPNVKMYKIWLDEVAIFVEY